MKSATVEQLKEVRAEMRLAEKRMEFMRGDFEDRISGRLAEMESRLMRYVNRRVEELAIAAHEDVVRLEDKIGALESGVGSLGARVKNLEAKVDTNHKQVMEVLKRLEARMDERFTNLESRLA